MTLEGFWHIWWLGVLWGGAIICIARGFWEFFAEPKRGHAVLYFTAALLCLAELGLR